MHLPTLLPLLALLPASLAQLSGPVGPTTSTASKRATKVCDVTKYGAKADLKTDLGPALASAWSACQKGGLVLIPAGSYAMSTFVTLKNGQSVAIQLDGVIHRTGTAAGNMILIRDTSDFELFSSTGKGAIQGNGYLIHATSPKCTGARLLRTYRVTSFSIHDLALVDAPTYHLTLDTSSSAELYNLAIRAADQGCTDALDIFSSNVHVHDVMVSNRDECVTVKSPAKNILVENVYCNRSGGSAIGSLGKGSQISTVTYRNVYTWGSNQMFMVKGNGGDGYVEDVVLENFIGHGNAYALDVDMYWASMEPVAGSGVRLSNFTVRGWRGTEADGRQRGPVKMACADGAPCVDMLVEDFAMWTEKGNEQVVTCRSAYGKGACLKAGTGKAYAAVTSTQSAPPKGYAAPTMAADLKAGFGTTVSIPIPALPTSYFPGMKPIHPVAGA